MGSKEPGHASSGVSKQVQKRAVKIGVFCQIALGICASGALASQSNQGDLFKNTMASIFGLKAGWRTGSDLDLATLINKAEQALNGNAQFQPLFDEDAVRFNVQKAAQDSYSSTVRFSQTYKGLDVVGNEAMVHFNKQGDVHDISGRALNIVLNTEPTLSLDQAHQLLNDRYGEVVRMSEPSKLKVFKDFSGRAHLVYHMLTSSTPTHDGQEVYLDAHNGQVVLEFDRAYDALSGKRTVFSADTDKAHSHVDGRGYPTDIDLSWYDKAIEDGERADSADRSALNAYRSAGLVHSYFKDNFNRDSYDDNGSRIVSVVHMGKKMNNAFWTSEFKVMAYGDGDGDHLTDLTYGLDVAAHELTHGLTASSAKLVYAGESGALNESYSDFFGKMVDYGNWDIGARIMSPKWGRRALRNMEQPEEFKQPSVKGGQFWVSTDQTCNKANDRCGVHTNSGVPSRAAVLIVKAIGKEKAEKLYYKVLTTRLSSTSNFHDARTETENECSQAFGADSSECQAVTAAFDTVKM